MKGSSKISLNRIYDCFVSYDVMNFIKMPILLLFIVLSSSSLFAYSNIAQYNSVKADSLPSNPADVLETESSIILGEQNQGESVTLPMGKRLIICLCQDRITLGTCNGPNYAWSPAASSSNSKILAIYEDLAMLKFHLYQKVCYHWIPQYIAQ